jgi:hypothetical protein
VWTTRSGRWPTTSTRRTVLAGRADHQDDQLRLVRVRRWRGRRHPVGLPGGMPDHPGDVKRWSVLDIPGPARHCEAQAAGMTPPAEVWGVTPRSVGTGPAQLTL